MINSVCRVRRNPRNDLLRLLREGTPLIVTEE